MLTWSKWGMEVQYTLGKFIVTDELQDVVVMSVVGRDILFLQGEVRPLYVLHNELWNFME